MTDVDELGGRDELGRELATAVRPFLEGRPGEYQYDRGYARRRPAYRAASRSFVRAKLRVWIGGYTAPEHA